MKRMDGEAAWETPTCYQSEKYTDGFEATGRLTRSTAPLPASKARFQSSSSRDLWAKVIPDVPSLRSSQAHSQLLKLTTTPESPTLRVSVKAGNSRTSPSLSTKLYKNSLDPAISQRYSLVKSGRRLRAKTETGQIRTKSEDRGRLGQRGN